MKNKNQEGRIVTEKQLQLEIEKVINFNLYNKKVINLDTYEQVNNILLKQISKEPDIAEFRGWNVFAF